MMQDSSEKHLTSWKEIADFLGVSVRTAQRYESELGLPVRRVGGEKGRGVVAEPRALSEWKNRVALSPPWWKSARFLRWYSVAVTGLCMVLAGVVAVDRIGRSSIGAPHDSHWLGSTLVVTDQAGREVWHRAFPHSRMEAVDHPRYHGDLNGDGRVESVVHWIPQRRDELGGAVYCFSDRGEQLWGIEPKRRVSDRRMDFSNIYVIRQFHVFDSPEKDGTRWVAATFVHHYEYPSLLVIVDGNGKTRGEYWHSGHLDGVTSVDVDGDGVDEVLAAGTSKAHSRAVVRVFDPRNVSGAEVLPARHESQLQGFAAGTEKATVLFARSRLNRLKEAFNFAYGIGPVSMTAAGKKVFQVFVSERLSRDQGYIIYTLRSDLSIDSVVASQSLIRTYVEYTLTDPRAKGFGEADLQELRSGYEVLRSR